MWPSGLFPGTVPFGLFPGGPASVPQVPAASAVFPGGQVVTARAVLVVNPGLVTFRVSLLIGTVLGEGLQAVLGFPDDTQALLPQPLTPDPTNPAAGTVQFDLSSLPPGTYVWWVRSAAAVVVKGLVVVERSAFQ